MGGEGYMSSTHIKKDEKGENLSGIEGVVVQM